MTRLTQAYIHHEAITHNLAVIKTIAPTANVVSMLKANAYGHDIFVVAPSIHSDCMGFCSLEEGLVGRQLFPESRILLVEGFSHESDLTDIVNGNFDIVVHDFFQITCLEKLTISKPISVWIKINTGMNRLGLSPQRFSEALSRLQACSSVNIVCVMTHFAEADVTTKAVTKMQWEKFSALTKTLPFEKSAANSAGILAWPETQVDWVRPGIMLYGISPFGDKTGLDHQLRPAMTLCSEIMTIQDCLAGDCVGYGGLYSCPQAMRIGVVAIGYGDGYPRHISSDAYVLIRGKPAAIIGRISMDMMSIDLSLHPEVGIGEPVILWGYGLPVEDIAKAASTSPYELVCQVTSRVPRIRVDDKSMPAFIQKNWHHYARI